MKKKDIGDIVRASKRLDKNGMGGTIQIYTHQGELFHEEHADGNSYISGDDVKTVCFIKTPKTAAEIRSIIVGR